MLVRILRQFRSLIIWNYFLIQSVGCFKLIITVKFPVEANFEIVSILGIKITAGSLDKSGKLQLNLNQYPDGVYIFCLLDPNGIINRKYFTINKN